MKMDRANLLNELYFGNIQPYAKQFDKSSEFGRLMVALCKRETELLSALEINPELKSSFEKYVSTSGEILAKTAEERFIDGFRLGSTMIIEVLGEYQGDLKDIRE